MERDRLIGLDGLRGIAAVAVLAYHVLDTYGTNGFLAVDFFFMLSGYVMARTYEKRLADRGAAGRFLVGRIAKLWPTMAIASLITVPWLWLRMPDQAPLITLANLFLLPTPSSFGLYILNPPAWSILYELVANAVHAAVLGRLSQRQLAAVAALLAGLLVWTAHAHGMNFVTNDNVLGLGLVRVLCPYVIGIVLYRWWRDRPPVALPAQAIWAAMPVYFVAGSLWWNGSWLPDTLFVLLLCPLMIAGGLAMKGEGRFARMAGFWGAVSFPLYAIHGPLLIVMRPAGVPLPCSSRCALPPASRSRRACARSTPGWASGWQAWRRPLPQARTRRRPEFPWHSRPFGLGARTSREAERSGFRDSRAGGAVPVPLDRSL